MAKKHSSPTKGQKRNLKFKNKTQTRKILRILLAILLIPLAFSLSLLPDVMLEIPFITMFFIFGAFFGTISQLYWIRVIIREAEFYAHFYSVAPHKTYEKFNRETISTHTKNVLPFYIFGILVFIILWFILGIFNFDLAYSLPFVLGAMEGVPLGYYLANKIMFKEA